MTILPDFFTVSCEKPYDRHNYELVRKNGKIETFQSWEMVQLRWFETPPHFKSHINVIDKKTKGGFK